MLTHVLKFLLQILCQMLRLLRGLTSNCGLDLSESLDVHDMILKSNIKDVIEFTLTLFLS